MCVYKILFIYIYFVLLDTRNASLVKPGGLPPLADIKPEAQPGNLKIEGKDWFAM
jgi:hypothetical protein